MKKTRILCCFIQFNTEIEFHSALTYLQKSLNGQTDYEPKFSITKITSGKELTGLQQIRKRNKIKSIVGGKNVKQMFNANSIETFDHSLSKYVAENKTNKCFRRQNTDCGPPKI